MTPDQLFYIIIGILVISFLIDKLLDLLNAQHFDDPVPEALHEVYDSAEYERSQQYKKENYRFGLLTSFVSMGATLAFFFLDGFAVVDAMARSVSDHSIIVALVFFGIIVFASELLTLPFRYYSTFVIEEKYGFNKTDLSTFIIDKVKGWAMMAVLGGILLSAMVWFYETTGMFFWLYAWGMITVFIVLMNLFYARLVVPLFNKQTPLESGSLRSKIEDYAKKVGFTLDAVFVVDGSKRSTKANAYFSGFGSEKRITLYDTLLHDLEEEEIVAVLAHEVGHYKKNHNVVNLFLSIGTMGITLWILSLLVGNPLLSEALHVAQPSFHIGLIAFGVLYSPISEVTGLGMNYLSRTFEYQADTYAKETYAGNPLISALRKLSGNSLSNLTPHPAFVTMYYSHPTLLQRFQNLLK